MAFRTIVVVTLSTGLLCNCTRRRRKLSTNSNCRFRNCNWWPGCGRLQYRSRIASSNRMNWSAHFGIFNSSKLFGSMNVQAELDVRIASILSVVTEKSGRGQMNPKESDFVVTYIAPRWSAISLDIWLVWGRRSDCRSHLDNPMFHAPLVRRTAFRQLNARINGRLWKCHRSQCTASPPIIAPNHEWIPATTTVTYHNLISAVIWQLGANNSLEYLCRSVRPDWWLAECAYRRICGCLWPMSKSVWKTIPACPGDSFGAYPWNDTKICERICVNGFRILVRTKNKTVTFVERASITVRLECSTEGKLLSLWWLQTIRFSLPAISTVNISNCCETHFFPAAR